MAQLPMDQAVQRFKGNEERFDSFVNDGDTKDVTTRTNTKYPTLQKAIKQMFENGGLPATPFDTLQALTDSELPESSYAVVTNDERAKNGVYRKVGENWERQGFNDDVRTKIIELKTAGIKNNYDDNNIPVLVDGDNNILIGYSKSKDEVLLAGVDNLGTKIRGITNNFDSRYLPVLTDANGSILIGYDKKEDKVILAGVSEGTVQDTTPTTTRQLKPLSTKDYNHFLFYGQSLAVGAAGLPVISTAQPYSNLTFDTSPRMDTEPSGFMPLVEQFNNPSSDGKNNRGETICSGAANYASRSMLLDEGIYPDNHIIVSSTAGRGSSSINQISKGTEWYPILEKHVQKAKDYSASKTYKVQLVGWLQGEADTGGMSESEYFEKLSTLFDDINSDIKTISNQDEEVEFLTYQTSYGAARRSDIAKAQLALSMARSDVHLVAPCYFLPIAPDKVHLTNIGNKWLGAYFGRAYKQRVIENREPDSIRPLSATVSGDTITVNFKVPSGGLVLDAYSLASTKDYGFRVVDSSGTTIEIASITTNQNTVIIKTSEIVTDGSVRYALDYLANSISIGGGASGNLRDTTKDSIDINGSEYPMYHVCPHFELPLTTDKGI